MTAESPLRHWVDRDGALLRLRLARPKANLIDAAMIDGAALMMTPFFGARASGFWGDRGTNMLDTGAPYYEVYETREIERTSLDEAPSEPAAVAGDQ